LFTVSFFQAKNILHRARLLICSTAALSHFFHCAITAMYGYINILSCIYNAHAWHERRVCPSVCLSVCPSVTRG